MSQTRPHYLPLFAIDTTTVLGGGGNPVFAAGTRRNIRQAVFSATSPTTIARVILRNAGATVTYFDFYLAPALATAAGTGGGQQAPLTMVLEDFELSDGLNVLVTGAGVTINIIGR